MMCSKCPDVFAASAAWPCCITTADASDRNGTLAKHMVGGLEGLDDVSCFIFSLISPSKSDDNRSKDVSWRVLVASRGDPLRFEVAWRAVEGSSGSNVEAQGCPNKKF